MHTTSFILIVTAVAIYAVYLAFRFFKENRQITRELRRYQQQAEEQKARIAELTAPKPPLPPRTEEQREVERQTKTLERLKKQLQAVQQERVTFSVRKVMGRDELSMFYSALQVTNQPKPRDPYPFYVFPQVSLGEVIETSPRGKWWARDAHQAINSRRCDILLATRHGIPIAVLEYQGAGHYIDSNAELRDEIKRIAVGRAGIPFVEIPNGTSPYEIRQRIQGIFDQHMAYGNLNTGAQRHVPAEHSPVREAIIRSEQKSARTARVL